MTDDDSIEDRSRRHHAETPGERSIPASPIRQRLAILAAAATATVVGAALFVSLYTGDAKGVYGAGSCYYDGRFQRDCPKARRGPAADTAWVYAAVIDSLYFGRVRAVPADRELVVVERQTSTGDQRHFATASLERLIADAAPEAPRELAARYLAANTSPTTLRPLWTVAGRQVFFDTAATRRFFAPGSGDHSATRVEEYVPRAGLLTLSRVGFDRAREWALVYVAVRDAERRGAGSLALLRRTRDGRWAVWRVVPAPAAPADGEAD